MFELVQSAESEEKNATDIQRTVAVAVNAVQKTSEIHARSTCYLCGSKQNGRDCQLYIHLLYAIIVHGKQGHLARVCRNSKGDRRRAEGREGLPEAQQQYNR